MIDIQSPLYPLPYRKLRTFSTRDDSTSIESPPSDDIFCPQESRPYHLTMSKTTREIPNSSHTKPMSTVAQYCYPFFYNHLHNPYPSLQEKLAIVEEASCSQVNLTTISNWFTNSRRRSGWIDICNEYYKGDTKAMVEVCTHVLVSGGTRRRQDPQGVVENILSMQTKVKAWDEEQAKPRDWVVDLANLLREITLEEEGELRSASQGFCANTASSSPLPWAEGLDLESTASSAISESRKRGREEENSWEAEARNRCVSRTSTISTSPSEEPSEPESTFSVSPLIPEDDRHSAKIKRHRVANAFENELDHTYAFESPETHLLGLWDFPFTFSTPLDSLTILSPEILENYTESAPSNCTFSAASNKRTRSQFETSDFIPSKKPKQDHDLQATTLEFNTPVSTDMGSESSSSITNDQEIRLCRAELAHPNVHEVDISPPDESWELDVNLFDWASFMNGFAGDGLLETSDGTHTHQEEELDLSLTFLQDIMSPELDEQELHPGDSPIFTADSDVGSSPLFDQHEYIQGNSSNHVHCKGGIGQSKCRSHGLGDQHGDTLSPSKDFLNQTQFGSEFSSNSESFEQAAEELRNLLLEWSSASLGDNLESPPIGVFVDSKTRP